MTPELLKKLDQTKMYSWDEVMDIATCISTQIMVEFMTSDTTRRDILYAVYNIPITARMKQIHGIGKKQSKST